MATGGGTDNEYLTQVIKAKHIYNATGHALWPWEVTDLSNDWLDAILAIEVDVPRKKKNITEIQNQAK